MQNRIKLKTILLLTVLALFCLCACSAAIHETDSESAQMAAAGQEMDDYEFLKDMYGMSNNELDGLDCAAFVDDYELRERDFTAEEVRKIIRDMKDFYQYDEKTAVFGILDEEGRKLTEGDEIRKIAYYMNKGTFVQKIVADLDEQMCYIDEEESYRLSTDGIEKLKALPETYGLYSWNSRTEGPEMPSTGNFAWKLVFELSDGSYAVYDGYTRDGSRLPDRFEEFETEMLELVKR